jgi:diguanylate cyclase (GGDEF)-like protein/PAS domain S-box-containing protein
MPPVVNEPDRFIKSSLEVLFKNSPEAIVLFDSNHCVADINRSFSALFGYNLEDIRGRNVDDVMNLGKNSSANPGYTSQVMSGDMVEGEGVRYTKYGEPVYVLIKGIPIVIDGELCGGYGIYSDITEQKKAEEKLRKSEERNRALVNAIPDMMFRYTSAGVYLDAEIKYSDLMSEQAKSLFESGGLIGRRVVEMLPPKPAALITEAIKTAAESGELQVVEYTYPVNNVELVFEARLVAAGSGEVVSIVRDITERKSTEAQLKYLSLHDHLTGLYNRAYFEDELKRLELSREYPISVISVDLDSLKLINDTLGHAAGDNLIKACAKVMKASLRKSDILARIGGDEFALLLPQTNLSTGMEVVQRIHLQVDLYNRANSYLPLSISIGLASAESSQFSLEETYQEADERMYREKLQKGAAVKTYLVDALVSSLGEKDYLNNGHARRIEAWSMLIAKKRGLNRQQMAKLKLMAKVHDLGKVAVPDELLFKKNALNEEEWKVMRQHPEKGYRIALVSRELAEVAELILKHHEHYDGGGYPLGLSGEEIPIECRILSIAEAFEVMTGGRTYCEAIGEAEALSELRRCSGFQFDPALVETFINLAKGQRI